MKEIDFAMKHVVPCKTNKTRGRREPSRVDTGMLYLLAHAVCSERRRRRICCRGGAEVTHLNAAWRYIDCAHHAKGKEEEEQNEQQQHLT